MKSVYVPFEIILDIFEQMRPIDLIKIKNLNKTCKHYIDIILKKKMNQFQKSLDAPKELFDSLNENVLMSGSCMVQYLLGEKYNSDIDIFMDINILNYKTIHTKLCDNGYISDDTFSNYPSNFKVYNFEKKNKTKIQLIVCKDVKDNISNFDFNIVKNYYDGKNFIIKDINNLSKKKELLEFNQRQPILVGARIEKYINRGFKFEIRNKELTKYKTFNEDLCRYDSKVIKLFNVKSDYPIICKQTYENKVFVIKKSIWL